MSLQELMEAATAGRVEKIEVISLEGSLYVIQARLVSGGLQSLRDQHGQILRLRSTTQVRELLGECVPLPCELVQHCAHDEMCAVRGTAVQPLRVPFTLEQPW